MMRNLIGLHANGGDTHRAEIGSQANPGLEPVGLGHGGPPANAQPSMTPVVVGTALAWAMERHLHWPAVVAALIASAFIQMGTNLHNDAADSRRGGDGPDRVGPPRATASGLLNGTTVSRAACACFAVAALMGAYLIWVGGWPIFLLGVLSILSGWAYTGGPFPIAYTPLGELFVIAFFGLGAVGGTYWLCTGTLTLEAIAAVSRSAA